METTAVTTEGQLSPVEAAERTRGLLKQVQAAEHDMSVNVFKSYKVRSEQIEAKQACMRVQFLDWLSGKLLEWSKKTKEISDHIDSPCFIKLPVPEEKGDPYSARWTIGR